MLLPVLGKLTFSVYLEIMDAVKGIPAYADIDARFHIIFPAGRNKILYNIAFAIAPFNRFQTVGIHIALVEGKACFMGGGQDGYFTAGIPGCSHPLVGIQLFGIKYTDVRYGGDPVDVLLVFLPVKYMQVIMKYGNQLRMLPG